MSVIEPPETGEYVYILLGIGDSGFDQVIAVFRTFDLAKRYSIGCLCTDSFYDIWIEKHPLL